MPTTKTQTRTRTRTATGGLKEGFAKSVSQSMVYGIESRKTQLQVFGKPTHVPARNLIFGCGTSGITAGVVFTTYYSIYNNMITSRNPYIANMAGIAAGLATSIIKIPVGNSMRILQTGKSPNILAAGVHLFKSGSLYKGYQLSLIEDIIEMDMRMRLYKTITAKCSGECPVNLATQTSIGGLSGAIASAATTPFDTLKSRLIHATHSTRLATSAPPRLTNLYAGVAHRSLSNAFKSAGFFMLFEIFNYIDKK